MLPWPELELGDPKARALGVLRASGVRLALTLARTLRLRDAKRGVATMCVGVGQGVSLLVEAA